MAFIPSSKKRVPENVDALAPHARGDMTCRRTGSRRTLTARGWGPRRPTAEREMCGGLLRVNDLELLVVRAAVACLVDGRAVGRACALHIEDEAAVHVDDLEVAGAAEIDDVPLII